MGGGVPSAALARLVGRENGGSSGGAMPAGTDRSRTRAASGWTRFGGQTNQPTD
jgi:hypothetical protein